MTTDEFQETLFLLQETSGLSDEDQAGVLLGVGVSRAVTAGATLPDLLVIVADLWKETQTVKKDGSS